MTKIAFVVQRYGAEINGGAEALCRGLAEKLAVRHQVEVLTTTAVNYVTWKNQLPPGTSVLNGVTVRRFRVNIERKRAIFDRIYDIVANVYRFEVNTGKWRGTLASVYPYNHESWKRRPKKILLSAYNGFARWWLEPLWMWLQGPISTELTRHLARHHRDFDAIIFISYSYLTSFRNIPLAADRAMVFPTAHNEPALYLKLFDKVCAMPRFHFFNTTEERDLYFARFPKAMDRPCSIVGTGIEVTAIADVEEVDDALITSSPYIIYVGRIEPSKGCDTLFKYFQQYIKESGSDLRLVLVGKSEMPIPESKQIQHAGFVSERVKNRLILEAQCLVMPSPYESLSLVMLEAWALKRPVLAFAGCDVLAGQCKRSGGGRVYADYDSFASTLNSLLDSKALTEHLGESGKAFVDENYSWETVLHKIESGIETMMSQAQQKTQEQVQ